MSLDLKRRVLFVSLFNNFTGSTKVLSQVIEACLKENMDIEIITSPEEGFLSNIDGVKYHFVNYKWSDSKIILFYNYFKAQVAYFFILAYRLNRSSVVYINTITPIGAFAACIFKSIKPLVHVHEKFVRKTKLHESMEWLMNRTGGRKIFVSNYLFNAYDKPENSVVIHNAVNDPKQINSSKRSFCEDSKIILMIASCRTYKGIAEFVKLANILPNFHFELVLSAKEIEVKAFMKNFHFRHSNYTIHTVQNDLSDFYKRASLVLNLSLPKEWIETFGMTILEALSHGKPCIVPPIGGPLELIDDAVNGYLIDPVNVVLIKEKIEQLFSDTKLYEQMSFLALEKFKKFDRKLFNEKILKEINCIKYD
jgi:glycosyltransferase involved in cell wall biosynthesis